MYKWKDWRTARHGKIDTLTDDSDFILDAMVYLQTSDKREYIPFASVLRASQQRCVQASD